jgi:glutamate-ammonia-ligase adenylyltransferase
MLQLRHGHEHPRVRTRVTQTALAELGAAGLLAAGDVRALSAGYTFLRAVENRLRLERNQPVDALDADAEALLALARRLHYEGDDAEVVTALQRDHAAHRDAIRAIYDRCFAAAGAPTTDETRSLPLRGGSG